MPSDQQVPDAVRAVSSSNDSESANDIPDLAQWMEITAAAAEETESKTSPSDPTQASSSTVLEIQAVLSKLPNLSYMLSSSLFTAHSS